MSSYRYPTKNLTAARALLHGEIRTLAGVILSIAQFPNQAKMVAEIYLQPYADDMREEFETDARGPEGAYAAGKLEALNALFPKGGLQ